ncbi:MAG: cytochrome c oxidase subunit II [Candidatus Eremiobacteraeota bacterium]|nr:cytochrome c oxidase subunit II [Candidatus Eremiobacteraeota bacterium]
MNRWIKNWQPLLAALLASGCSLSGPQSILDADGPVARLQYETFLVTFWVSVAIFAVVGGMFLYCLVKFRAPGGEVPRDYPLPDQGHGNPLIEIGVIFVSVLLLGIVAVPAVYGVFYAGTVPEGQKALRINVTGYQWWWKFEYPELGVVTGNEAGIPVGRPVEFHVQTADVLHSFWIPRLGGKMDLTPGQDDWIWLQADKPGVYWGQCTEFCGESHAFMRMRVQAFEPDQFDKWVVEQKNNAVNLAAPPAFGKFQCGVCHTVRGVPGAAGLVGPDLTHVGSRTSIAAGIKENQPGNLKAWIHNPNELKPGNTMYKAGYKAMFEPMHIEMTGADEDALVEYLTSLK